MNQCPYRIKDALAIGWFNCQSEAGHSGDHVPPLPQVGRKNRFEGIWHRPGEKSTADLEPHVPSVPSVWTAKGSEEITPSNQHRKEEVKK